MNRSKNIHFVGIGGSGMNGIAEVLLNQNYNISGSDLVASNITERLQQLGAKIYIGHKASNITDADIVVVSTAIDANNAEIQAAKRKKIPILRRAQMLGELMRFKNSVAVAGTHGKTTTTSLLASIFTKADLDPTFVIGGILNSAGTNARLGSGEYFITEADESDASFLYLNPRMIVVTNIDADHMQTYDNNFTKLKNTFVSFLQRLPFYWLASVCIDDPTICEIINDISRPIKTFGFNSEADIVAYNFKQNEIKSTFCIKRNNKKDLTIKLNLPGKHNVLNALAAISIAEECGISDQVICEALQKFQGVGRRFQIRGKLNGKALLIDDYGHHPKEISVTIQAIKAAWPNKRLVLAFQPHRYTRTRDLMQEFAEVLATADLLLLSEIYPASEIPIPGINSKILCDAIAKISKNSPIYLEEITDLPKILYEVLRDGDILLLQGAGSIGKIAEQLASKCS